MRVIGRGWEGEGGGGDMCGGRNVLEGFHFPLYSFEVTQREAYGAIDKPARIAQF
jgi:hypothetical protein